MEVGRHLVQQDQDGLVAVEEFEPILLVRCLGPAGPERLELLALAELIGDLAPEEMVRVVAAVEGRDVGGVEGIGVEHAAAVLLAQLGMLGEQAKPDQQVGLTAAHGLLEMEDGLRRGPASRAMPSVIRSCMPWVMWVFSKKRCHRPQRDQLIELFDLVAELDRQGVRLEFAGVADGFHAWARLSLPRVFTSVSSLLSGDNETHVKKKAGPIRRCPAGIMSQSLNLAPGRHVW